MPASQDSVFNSAAQSRVGRRPAVVGGLATIAVLGLVFAVRIIGDAPEVDRGGALLEGLPPAAVYVQQAIQQVSQNTTVVTGTLRARARAEVAAREAGAVVEVLIDEGDFLEANAILARLDDRRTFALLHEAQASVTAATSLVEQRSAELDRAQADLTMKRGLLQRKAVSQSDILDAESRLAVARAQRDAAQDGVAEATQRVAYLEVQLEDTVIRAPFSGVVVQRSVELGEWVAVGSVIATLVTIDPVEAWLRVPSRYRNGVNETANRLQVEQASTGRRLTPSHVQLIPDVDPLSQLFTVVATLDNSGRDLTPGESITGTVPVGSRVPHWQFPVDALIRTPTGDFIYTVGADQTAHRIAVNVAFEKDGMAHIPVSDSPLGPGDLLVIEGNERLQPGQALLAQERKAESADGGQP